METAQPGQGLELMVYGMGMVVVFLVLLVFATRFLSAVIRRFFPGEVPVSPAASLDSGRPQAPAEVPADTVDPAVLAAIAVAVHAHRQTRALPLSR